MADTVINPNEDARVFCTNCKRLLPLSMFSFVKKGNRLHKHCKECESGEWDKQRTEQEQEWWKQNSKVCARCGERLLRTEFYESETSDDGLQSWCKKCQNEMSHAANMADNQPLPEPDVKGERDRSYRGPENMLEYLPTRFTKKKLMQVRTVLGMDPDGAPRQIRVWKDRGFIALVGGELYSKTTKYMEIKGKGVLDDADGDDMQKVPTRAALGEHDATMQYRDKQKCIAFNAILSEQVVGGGYTKCQLIGDRHDRQFLVFNNVDGANVTRADGQTLAVVSSSDMVRSLAERFNLKLGDKYHLHITRNLSKKPECLNVEILAAQSSEEYIKTLERRMRAEEKNTADGKTEKPAAKTQQVEKKEPPQENDRPLSIKNADDVICYIIEKCHVTERDLAFYLYRHGWRLEEPVTSYKKFQG